MKKIIMVLSMLSSLTGYGETISRPSTEIDGVSYKLDCESSPEAVCKLLGKNKYLGHSCRTQIFKAVIDASTRFVHDIGDGSFDGENAMGPDYNPHIAFAMPAHEGAPESLILKT